MTLYIDTENKKLVQSLTSDRSVATPVFMQGDNEPLIIHLLEKGEESLYKEKNLVIGTDFLRIAIARFKGYPKALTYASGYTANENGGVEVMLPLNTTAIENALQENEYISAFLEVEYSNTDGKIITILQTSCRLKNDLIDNAPAIELQDQFYDKVYVDTVFSKKSANLSDLSNKADSRANLDVYSKSEVYNKSEIDTQEAKNLKNASNLSDLADKAAARTNIEVYSKNETDSSYAKKTNNLSDLVNASDARKNLDVPQKRDLIPLGFSGVWTDGSLSANASYGQGLGDDLPPAGDIFTFMTTFLAPTGLGATLFSPYYGDYNCFYPYLYADRVTFSIGDLYNYDDETGESSSIAVKTTLSKAIEYGDKIAITLENKVVKFYKNTELVGSIDVPSEMYRNAPSNFLSWNGLKKNLLYSNSLCLPLTSAQGKTAKLNYSIEDFVNDIPPPVNLLKSHFMYARYTYPAGATLSNYSMKGEGGYARTSMGNVLKFSPALLSYSYTRDITLSEQTVYAGIKTRIQFKIYIPSSNPNFKKVQLRIGSLNIGSAGTVLSRSSTIDASGFITTQDSWLDVDVSIIPNTTTTIRLYFYNATTSSMKIEDITLDAVYFTRFIITSYGGITGYFYGCADTGFWKNYGSSNIDLVANGFSYPGDTGKQYILHWVISSFADYSSMYFDNTLPAGLELSQIIVRFDAAIPDTSKADDLYARNIFKAYFESIYVCDEQVPELRANTAFNIFPQKGLQASFYSIGIDPMYACSCGGTVDMIFTKVK
jgi:hypothetical protein|nr:MAG TPA: hypothetical protein [Caudoviricetes sp.]